MNKVQITVQKIITSPPGDVFIEVSYPPVKIGGITYTVYQRQLRILHNTDRVVKYRHYGDFREEVDRLIAQEIKPSFPKEVQHLIEVVDLPDENIMF